MGTTLILGAWMIGGMGAITEPGGSRTTDAIGGRGMTGTADTTVVRTGGGICGGEDPQVTGCQGCTLRAHTAGNWPPAALRMGLDSFDLAPWGCECSLTLGPDRNYAERGPGQPSFHLGLNQLLLANTERATEDTDLHLVPWSQASSPPRPIKPSSPSLTQAYFSHLPLASLPVPSLPHR